MSKKVYLRPSIKKQHLGAANKFAGFHPPETVSSIDGILVEDLLNKYGSPLFIFSETTIRKKIAAYKQAFESRYPMFQPTWSYKTNYLNDICKVFHKEGFWAETVSAFEYEKARKNGIPGNRIIFNGPYKPYEALKLAVSEGARIHADHLDEIKDLMKIADELGRKVDVSIRISMDTGSYPTWSRFGFNLESGHALEAATKIAESGGKLNLTGVHSHIGTFMLEPSAYKKAALQISKFYKVLRDDLRQPMQYIDLGGGFVSANKLKNIYQSGASLLPSFDQYAEAICSALYDAFSPEEPPSLFLESGRALVDESGFLASTVVGTKTLPTGRRALILDAGVNLLYTSTWYDLNISPIKDYSKDFEEVILYGPLCMNIDIVRETCILPNMARGESLLIHPVGAYNVTQWMQFIEMRPAVVLIQTNGQIKQMRRRETTDDINAMEVES
ncbi:diaminopimelate decarboxylase [Leptospira kobayashii]|uniref:Diaminopimelate decarboxylase n=1 Tax=Leptospira kobayashii TaxID=1917830 RepID=A0ABM7USX0_9LEPT|nr:alanine racemase [Leptospira kobayashii]BDA80559.1 diaminopimelate decarboxylase [Leptospira kobayashii]